MAGKPKSFKIEKRGRKKWLVVRARLPTASLDYLVSWCLILGGLIGIGWVAATSMTPPPASSAIVPPAPHSVAEASTPKGLQPSKPVHLEALDIGLSTDLVELGKNPDDSLETPSRYDIAGWYKFSPTPGEIGPAIITGHVDNYLGPAVFFYLKDLAPGQIISVTREDGSVVKFRVEHVALFDQQNFPTDEVYGDIDYPGLRLITCGGVYNTFSGHYSHNTVVYAAYVRS